jgi:general secretion pathway protein A
MREELLFFDLKRPPFAKDFALSETWIEPSRENAVSLLVRAVEARQHALVTGEPGVGKTVVVRAMAERLPATHHRVTYVWNVAVGRRDFYRNLSVALGFEPRGTAAAVFDGVQRELRAGWAEHRLHPVLIIDEAHVLPDATLQHLHILANFDRDANPLLSLVLVGLPELRDRLKLGVHRSLLTRIGTHVDIGRTTPEDTAAYVRNRLEYAGSRSEIFGLDAITTVHEMTAGVPRVVATLADMALRVAADRKEKHIGRAIIREAWKILPHH